MTSIIVLQIHDIFAAAQRFMMKTCSHKIQ